MEICCPIKDVRVTFLIDQPEKCVIPFETYVIFQL